jgi:hypothetical protein
VVSKILNPNKISNTKFYNVTLPIGDNTFNVTDSSRFLIVGSNNFRGNLIYLGYSDGDGSIAGEYVLSHENNVVVSSDSNNVLKIINNTQREEKILFIVMQGTITKI